MKNTLSGNEGRGFMKILVASDTDTVVGVHLIGPETAEIIQVRCRHGHSAPARALCPRAGCHFGTCDSCDKQAGVCLHASLAAPPAASEHVLLPSSGGMCPCLQRMRVALRRAGPESL